jgi:CheY-like chemotaxis protein/DNA-binding MarR family transcriptional regulator
MSAMNELKHDVGKGGCSVLIVDDDSDALEEYAEIARTLGYTCLVANNAYSAMKLITDDLRIGIVITDLKMPTIDGLSFLDELDTRFSNFRPIVSVVVTGYGSFESLVAAMRFNARDFLQKPVTMEALASVLRRASRTWNQVAFNFKVGGQVEDGAAKAKATPAHEPAPASELTDREVLLMAKSLVRKRERRGEFLDSELFSDPSWDILLDLTSAKLEGISVPVSSACAATHLPLSTALRYVRSLVDAGLVKRWKDPTDRRRDLLEIEEKTMEAMRGYLSTVRP